MDYQPSKRQKLNQWRVDDDSHDSSTLSLTGISKHPSHRQMEGSRLLHSNASRTSQHEAVPSLDRSSHPDLFKLQLQELLGTLRPKYETRMARVEKEVHRLRQVIELIPDREGRPVRNYFHLSIFIIYLLRPISLTGLSPLRPSRRRGCSSSPIASVYRFRIPSP